MAEVPSPIVKIGLHGPEDAPESELHITARPEVRQDKAAYNMLQALVAMATGCRTLEQLHDAMVLTSERRGSPAWPGVPQEVDKFNALLKALAGPPVSVWMDSHADRVVDVALHRPMLWIPRWLRRELRRAGVNSMVVNTSIPAYQRTVVQLFVPGCTRDEEAAFITRITDLFTFTI